MNIENDIYGTALLSYQKNGFTEDIKTFSTLGGEDIYPLPYLFRDFDEMPNIEQEALQLSKGKILDIGCGAGSHSLYLQKREFDIHAIDISKGAVKTCKCRGINNVNKQSIWDLKDKKYDTILLLMNGAGMCGKLNKLSDFLFHLKTLLNKNGQILLDSSDVIYMFEDEEGNYIMDNDTEYYGETQFIMQYNNQKSEPFNWLYIDFENLKQAATFCGLECEKIMEGNHYDYLAKITF